MNAFCILFADSNETLDLSELSNERTLASVPFGGRYRLVDFVLSSLVGAQIHNIGIVTRNNYGSLMDHVGWGKDWDLNRKNGGIKFLTPFLTTSEYAAIGNRIDALNSVMDYIKSALPEYCILCDSNIVMNIDLEKFMEYHEEKGGDITFAYTTMQTTAKELEVMLDDNGKLVDTMYHQYPHVEEKNVQLNMIILKRDLLVSLIEKGVTYGWYSIKKDVIAHSFNEYEMYGYKVDGYTSVINSVETFYKSNMDLLDKDVRLELFMGKNPILTRIKDSVPTIYGEECNVTNSLVADGCTIEGTVENCIIFRDVKIAKGAVVKNSIIMQGTIIAENASLNCVITDKGVTIGADRMLAGTETMPFIINKGKNV